MNRESTARRVVLPALVGAVAYSAGLLAFLACLVRNLTLYLLLNPRNSNRVEYYTYCFVIKPTEFPRSELSGGTGRSSIR
jgi:ABC-type Fe3+ transport system permease subunit